MPGFCRTCGMEKECVFKGPKDPDRHSCSNWTKQIGKEEKEKMAKKKTKSDYKITSKYAIVISSKFKIHDCGFPYIEYTNKTTGLKGYIAGEFSVEEIIGHKIKH